MKREISFLFADELFLFLRKFDGSEIIVRYVNKLFLLDDHFACWEYICNGSIGFVSGLDYDYIGVGSMESLNKGIMITKDLYGSREVV